MGTQLPPEKRAYLPHPIFGPRLLWPNGWMDEDATWYGSRQRPRPQCIRRCPSSPRKGHSGPSFRHLSTVAVVAHLGYCWALVTTWYFPCSKYFLLYNNNNGKNYPDPQSALCLRADLSPCTGWYKLPVVDIVRWSCSSSVIVPPNTHFYYYYYYYNYDSSSSSSSVNL